MQEANRTLLIIKALIQGPCNKELMQTIPAGTALNALYVTPDATCYVDLGSAIYENHPGGCKSELLTIYSIVNSLVLNLSNIDAAKILIEGHETLTLAGHVNTQSAFNANMLLIR